MCRTGVAVLCELVRQPDALELGDLRRCAPQRSHGLHARWSICVGQKFFWFLRLKQPSLANASVAFYDVARVARTLHVLPFVPEHAGRQGHNVIHCSVEWVRLPALL